MRSARGEAGATDRPAACRFGRRLTNAPPPAQRRSRTCRIATSKWNAWRSMCSNVSGAAGRGRAIACARTMCECARRHAARPGRPSRQARPAASPSGSPAAPCHLVLRRHGPGRVGGPDAASSGAGAACGEAGPAAASGRAAARPRCPGRRAGGPGARWGPGPVSAGLPRATAAAAQGRTPGVPPSAQRPLVRLAAPPAPPGAVGCALGTHLTGTLAGPLLADIAGREAKQARSIASLDKVLTHYQRSLGLEMQPGEGKEGCLPAAPPFCGAGRQPALPGGGMLQPASVQTGRQALHSLPAAAAVPASARTAFRLRSQRPPPS